MSHLPRERDFDVLIFGASGYTGERVARTLSKWSMPGGAWATVRWAIAGRSQKKLDGMLGGLASPPTGVVIADTSDEASLRAMSARTHVLMNATGPYRFYGEAVVSACIATTTDYCDLCGEPEFIDRCQLKHSDAARTAGVLVVHACAFDSVPADLGTLFTAMQFPPPALCAHADMYHVVSVEGNPPGASGHATTFRAAVHGFGGAGETRAQRKAPARRDRVEALQGQHVPPPTSLAPPRRCSPSSKRRRRGARGRRRRSARSSRWRLDRRGKRRAPARHCDGIVCLTNTNCAWQEGAPAAVSQPVRHPSSHGAHALAEDTAALLVNLADGCEQH